MSTCLLLVQVYQRQLAKQGLSAAIVDETAAQSRTFSQEELRALFEVCVAGGVGGPCASFQCGECISASDEDVWQCTFATRWQRGLNVPCKMGAQLFCGAVLQTQDAI